MDGDSFLNKEIYQEPNKENIPIKMDNQNQEEENDEEDDERLRELWMFKIFGDLNFR